jgi:hypothetical protein
VCARAIVAILTSRGRRFAPTARAQVTQRAIAPKTAFVGARVSRVTNGSKVEMSRWKGMDMDISDDQQDITRGRGMVDSKFQGAAGIGGTHVRQIERALIHNG